MIKIFNYNKIMQNEIEEFILNSMNKELNIEEYKTFQNITKDLKDIDKNYIDTGGKMLFAYDTQTKQIVGTIAIKFENNIAVLKRFYVHEKYRKKKIGYLLYLEIEKTIRKLNINQIYLTSGKELENAHRFYERNGWKKEKTNPGIYVREGADLLKKEIGGNEKMKKTDDILDKAEVLIEAIPYVKEYLGKIIVIKYGGNAMKNEEQKENIAKQITLLKMLGIKVVLVHGGGPDIEEELKIKNIESKFEKGLRVTDEKTIDIVKTVLIGKTNAEIVKLLNLQNCDAIGLSGIDGKLISCEKLDEKMGFVGKISKIKKELILSMLDNNYIPVISPIGVDENGNCYNINADIAASEIAIAIKAKKILFLTNIDGLLNRNKELISLIEKEKIDSLIEDGTIIGGMIPKIKACQKCLENGVERTHILNGTKKNTILYEIFSDNGIGTMII